MRIRNEGLTAQGFQQHGPGKTSNTLQHIKQEVCTTYTLKSTVAQVWMGTTILCGHGQKDNVEMCDNEHVLI